jgi:hypothetical protein
MDMDPGSMVRGDELLKEARFVRAFPVIPVVTITGPDPRFGLIPSFRA